MALSRAGRSGICWPAWRSSGVAPRLFPTPDRTSGRWFGGSSGSAGAELARPTSRLPAALLEQAEASLHGTIDLEYKPEHLRRPRGRVAGCRRHAALWGAALCAKKKSISTPPPFPSPAKPMTSSATPSTSYLAVQWSGAQCRRYRQKHLRPLGTASRTISPLSIDQRWRRQTAAALNLPENGRVLDLATGTTDLALLIARRTPTPGTSIVGLDPSEGIASRSGIVGGHRGIASGARRRARQERRERAGAAVARATRFRRHVHRVRHQNVPIARNWLQGEWPLRPRGARQADVWRSSGGTQQYDGVCIYWLSILLAAPSSRTPARPRRAWR